MPVLAVVLLVVLGRASVVLRCIWQHSRDSVIMLSIVAATAAAAVVHSGYCCQCDLAAVDVAYKTMKRG